MICLTIIIDSNSHIIISIIIIIIIISRGTGRRASRLSGRAWESRCASRRRTSDANYSI